MSAVADGVTLETRGIPTVTCVSGGLALGAATLVKLSKLPSFRLAVLPGFTSLGVLPREELMRQAEVLFGEIERILEVAPRQVLAGEKE